MTKTVEERILDLQEKKRLLAEQAIEGGMKKGAFKLGLAEIIDLFKPNQYAPAADYPEEALRALVPRRRNSPALGRNPGVTKPESDVYGRRW